MAALFQRKPRTIRGSYNMTHSNSVLRGMTLALLGGATFMMAGGAAKAADLGGMKDKPVEQVVVDHTVTVNGGFTSDYVFRGISQSDNDPAAFAGIDLTYRMFYVGIWGSSVASFTSSSGFEFDVYAGVKRSWNGVEFDLGVLYYTYPGNDSDVEINYVEFKAAASTKLWREITLTGTVFYSPNYYAEAGDTWTIEGKAARPLPWWGLTLSGAYGFVTNEGTATFLASYGDDSYSYWNIGVSKIFREHFTVDLRYWGTNVDIASDYLQGIADDKVVATLTFNY